MSAENFKNDLIKVLLAAMHEENPTKLRRILRKIGWQDGDVTFRTTKSNNTWTEIHYWPWERPFKDGE